jgi:hypothetical protein
MSDILGIFNDEGMMDGPFYTAEEAAKVLLTYPLDENATIQKVCPDHEGQIEHCCEECYSDET